MNLYRVVSDLSLVTSPMWIEAPTMLQALAVWRQANSLEDKVEPDEIKRLGFVTRVHPPTVE